MPPVAPSPHRFLVGRQRQPPPEATIRAPVTRRDETLTSNGDQTLKHDYATPSQFVATPRFSFGKTRWSTRSPSPPNTPLIHTLRASGLRREDVEDEPENLGNGDAEMLDDEQSQALPMTEDECADSQIPRDWRNNLPSSPKRRRFHEAISEDGAPAVLPSPNRPTFKQSHTSASQLLGPELRFAQPTNSNLSSGDDLAGPHRPAFLRSTVAPQVSSEPLPEAFSPHRRGQKFVPGGMAATVQRWVMETGQAAVQSRRGQAYLRGEDSIIRVEVDETIGCGPYVLKARSADGEDANVLLTPRNNAESGRGEGIVVGSIVEIRAPTWGFEIDGTTWTVGVDWKLLSPSGL